MMRRISVFILSFFILFFLLFPVPAFAQKSHDDFKLWKDKLEKEMKSSFSSQKTIKPEIRIKNIPRGKIPGETDVTKCALRISPDARRHIDSGGDGDIAVNVSRDMKCPWRAVSDNQDWISLQSGHSGNESGRVIYTVKPNL